MALGDLPTGEEKRVRVREMFDRIAPRYDALNRIVSLGLDQRWRRRALAKIQVGAGDLVVDLACGTGDFCELVEALGARAIGVDFAREMLRQAAARGLRFPKVQGDGEWLPFATASVDAVTCGFALRNFVSLEAVLREIARIVRPGGRIALVDVDRPVWGPLRAAHSLYFDRLVPLVGGLLSDRSAYKYLPKSTAYLPAPEVLRTMLSGAGFLELEREIVLLGSAQILTGVRGPLTPVGGRSR
ncbi:MAG: ubiquinone/menaquinone biosynthesis methyltransferase [Deltaproteobacteria bacterium]|nr:ubiquinone/menaquinone biosynthesis methyltransferase [Deltaproteobacteria bacterium]